VPAVGAGLAPPGARVAARAPGGPTPPRRPIRAVGGRRTAVRRRMRLSPEGPPGAGRLAARRAAGLQWAAYGRRPGRGRGGAGAAAGEQDVTWAGRAAAPGAVRKEAQRCRCLKPGSPWGPGTAPSRRPPARPRAAASRCSSRPATSLARPGRAWSSSSRPRATASSPRRSRRRRRGVARLPRGWTPPGGWLRVGAGSRRADLTQPRLQTYAAAIRAARWWDGRFRRADQGARRAPE